MVYAHPIPDEAAAELAAAYADASPDVRNAVVTLLRALAAGAAARGGIAAKALEATARSFEAVAERIANLQAATERA